MYLFGRVFGLSPLLIGLVCFVYGEVTQNEDGTEGVINFQTPTLNDEEAHSKHMPSHLKCDACTAIVYQVYNFILTT